ncbi:hypothetical protein D3C75_1195160 [compost metagenome]
MEPSENDEVVQSFLNIHPEYKLEMEPFIAGLPVLHGEHEYTKDQGLQIFPDDYHSDGFYIARLRKQG